jgi:hypothetical protein
MRHHIILLGLVTFLVACASGPTSGVHRARDLITAGEIAETDARDAHHAIEILRPQWLSRRGPTGIDDPNPVSPSVFVDGSHMGNLDFLRTIHVRDIHEIRFWSPGDAAVDNTWVRGLAPPGKSIPSA